MSDKPNNKSAGASPRPPRRAGSPRPAGATGASPRPPAGKVRPPRKAAAAGSGKAAGAKAAGAKRPAAQGAAASKAAAAGTKAASAKAVPTSAKAASAKRPAVQGAAASKAAAPGATGATKKPAQSAASASRAKGGSSAVKSGSAKAVAGRTPQAAPAADAKAAAPAANAPEPKAAASAKSSAPQAAATNAQSKPESGQGKGAAAKFASSLFAKKDDAPATEKGVPDPQWERTPAEAKKARCALVGRVVACAAVLAITLLLALAVGDADYHATAIGWLPFICCVTAIVLAFAYAQVLRRSLVMEEVAEVGSCQRGRAVRFAVRFRNTCPLFYTRIEAHFFVSDLFGNRAGASTTTLALCPFEEYEMGFSTRFEHIGVYRAGLDSVTVTDFLRLFSFTVKAPKRTLVQVTPQLVEMGGLHLSNEAITETTRAKRTVLADSTNYAGVREYVKGDPLKTIHWKLSAKQRKYYTRIYEAYTNMGVDVVLDFTGPVRTPDEMMGMFDCVVETGLSVARYAREHGIDVQLHWVDRNGRTWSKPGITEAEMPAMIADMPLFSSDEEHRIEALDLVKHLAGSKRSQGNLVVCSANPQADLLTALISAKERRHAPVLFAVVPKRMEQRDREIWAAPFARLDNASVGYRILAESTEIGEAR